MDDNKGDFLSFERIEIEAGRRPFHTVFICQIKSLLNESIVEMSVRIELPHVDKKLSEIERDLASAIHEATNPARLHHRSL